MTYAQILESPDGFRLALRSVSWGTSEVSLIERGEGSGMFDLWELHTTDNLNGDYDPDPQGINQLWRIVAEVDDTNEHHIRVYPERMGEVAMLYLGLPTLIDPPDFRAEAAAERQGYGG